MRDGTREMIRALQEACMFCAVLRGIWIRNSRQKAQNRVDGDFSRHVMDEAHVFGIIREFSPKDKAAMRV